MFISHSVTFNSGLPTILQNKLVDKTNRLKRFIQVISFD